MIPLIGTVEELKLMKEVCVEVAEAVKKESGVEFSYLVGTMMEIPRACVVADEIASEAEFFSFGTNDLTQMTFDSVVTTPAPSCLTTSRKRYWKGIPSRPWIK